jgi:hypothetical protein
VPLVELIEQYCHDNEWWVAYPCDPRWSYFEPGEVLEVSDEEAQDMIKDGIARLQQP